MSRADERLSDELVAVYASGDVAGEGDRLEALTELAREVQASRKTGHAERVAIPPLVKKRRPVGFLDDGTPVMGAWRFYCGQTEITEEEWQVATSPVAAYCGTCAHFLPSEIAGSDLGSCRRNHGWHLPSWACADYAHEMARPPGDGPGWAPWNSEAVDRITQMMKDINGRVRAVDQALLASAMRKVLLSEDMYVDDESDRLRLDGHVHGGLSVAELAAVQRVRRAPGSVGA